MQLNTPLAKLAGIGPSFINRLQKLDLNTLEDLIYHFPSRYEDFSNVSKLSDVKVGDKVTIKGEVWQIKNAYTKFRKVITKALINDGSATIELVWFNQPYLTKAIKVGDRLNVAGEVSKFAGKLSIVSPDYEKADRLVHTGRLVPIYPETYGVSSKWLRNQISKILPLAIKQIEDYLPQQIKDNMLSLAEAITKIHFPPSRWEAEKARKRLGFDELFLINLATNQTRSKWQQKTLIETWKFTESDLNHFIKSLPFELTNAQKRVLSEIMADLKKPHPMNRLLQGEVGSGKTVVAAAIVYLAQLNGFQSLLMAPTEILAWQHYETLKKLLEPLELSIGLYTGSRKFTKIKNSRFATFVDAGARRAKLKIQNFIPDVIVGTHALLSDKIKPDKLGLVIIDEQHRFGVEQRTLLRAKGSAPHLLTMTATPIPRTVSLTIYGDLDISVIDEMPKGRQPVLTYLVPEEKRADAYKFIEKKAKEKNQVYIITPLIEESETQASAKAAKVEFERLQKVFPDLKHGLLHGRMKSKDKEQVINQFKSNQIDILVSTSVVEVGVDIPNATIMLIEGAQRFGLAALHQLRGRVGRGGKESFCLLFSDSNLPEENRRLKQMEKIDNGLRLAELDLKIRGAGSIFGYSQHGRFDLKVAKLTDLPLIEKTKSAASKILAENPSLDKYPLLKAKLLSVAKEVAPD